jgi:hypothetical protein
MITLGVITWVVVGVCALFVRNPPEGHLVQPPSGAAGAGRAPRPEFVWRDMLRTAQFWLLFIMYFFGGYSLKPFAITMVIGSIVGTYSSDFIATPIVFWWNERQKGKLVEELGHKRAGSQALEGQPVPATVAASVSPRAEQSVRRGRR